MEKNKSNLVSTVQRVRFILILIIFVVVFVLHVQGGVHLILGRLIRDLESLGKSYDEKMSRRRGWHYDFLYFIKENTPENANIVFPPPKGKYLKIGNLGFNDYFLLPRNLHHGNQQTLQSLTPPVYVVIHKEFPPFKVEGPRIMKDSENGLIHYRAKP